MLPSDTPPLPPAVPVEISLSTESVAVNGGQRMGLTGLSYQRPFSPHWWGGLSVYGASTGNRGGFFAWGLSSAYRVRSGPWQTEAGLFVGGGGGSPGWVGSGLMLRPHLEVAHAWGPVSVGLGVSGLSFPDGQVHAVQPYGRLRWATDAFIGSAAAPAAPMPAESDSWPAQTEFAAVMGRYRMAASPRRDGAAGTPDMRVGGLSFRRALPAAPWVGAQPYAVLTTLGAIGGGYDGYAELTGGLGLQWACLPSLALRTEATAGSAGAGATVDTGGGLVGKVSAQAVWRPAPDWSIAAGLGRMHSRGLFQAQETRLELAYRFWDVVPGAGPIPASAAASADRAPGDSAEPGDRQWSLWNLSAGVLSYPRMPRASGDRAALTVLDLTLERELGPSWRWTGQAATGVSGQAGGYATGLLGLGWLSPAGSAGLGNWRLGAELSLGAGGGGGVSTQGGLFGQARLQARYPFARDWALQFDAGRLRGAHGDWSSPVVGLGLVSHFARLEAHPSAAGIAP